MIVEVYVCKEPGKLTIIHGDMVALNKCIPGRVNQMIM